ncbi:MAG: NAD(P)-dependent oxidoreductase [Geminicoccaceae bacterium]
MRVLVTGASSFTGAWFVRALVEAGIEVVAPCRGAADDGDPLRRARLAALPETVRLVPKCPFGSPPFLDLIDRAGPFEALCHHAAEVGDFRRADFDVGAALAANTAGLGAVLDRLQAGGCRTVVVTGTVFETDEGEAGPSRAVNAYGLAKALTWQVWRHACEGRGFALGKFVVPAPFGPLEKPCLASSLIRSWLRGETPTVRAPHLVRDHIPASLLADDYVRFLRAVWGRSGTWYRRPSLFAESLGRFAERLAEAMRPRLELPCPVEIADPPVQVDEPVSRVNRDPLVQDGLAAFWDGYAGWWQRALKGDFNL